MIMDNSGDDKEHLRPTGSSFGSNNGVNNQIEIIEGGVCCSLSSTNINGLTMEEDDVRRQDSHSPLKDNEASAGDDPIVCITTDERPQDGDGQQCGLGSFRPRSLQFIAGGPKAFAFWSMLYLLIKTAGTVYIGSVISNIEKQFQLSSLESGVIVILNDVVDMVLVIFVAYFGRNGHRARIIAFGILLAGIGITICGIPHFLLEPYTRIPAGCNKTAFLPDVCSTGKDVIEKDDPCSPNFEQPSFDPVWWLVIGQILLGVGNVPIKPLGTTYIDDAVGKHTTPVYIAFLFIAVSLGPLLGFLLGSTAVSLFVDFDRVDPADQPTFPENDPRFIGAWWLGFICIGCTVMLLSVPFFFFPRHLPKSQERMREDERVVKEKQETSKENCIMMDTMENNKTHVDSDSDVQQCREDTVHTNKKPLHKTFLTALKGMYNSYRHVVTNTALLLLCISSAMEGANAAANATFSLKYYSVQFGVAPSLSSLLAIVIFPFNLLGSLIGGYVIKRKKWSPAKCALFLLFGDVVAILGIPIFLSFGCTTQAVAGVSAPYAGPIAYGVSSTMAPVVLPESVQQANAICNSNCTCVSEDYNPVCGADGLTYVSACYAGCLEYIESETDGQNRTIYAFDDCDCIIGANSTAVDGECAPDCQMWQIPVIIVTSIILIFCGGLGQSGLVLITLRIVNEDIRSAALGFQSVFLNLLGFFPAPIYFGAAISATCILWDYNGGEKGACWIYDRDKIRYAFHGLSGSIRIVSAVLFLGVYFELRKKKHDPNPEEIEGADSINHSNDT